MNKEFIPYDHALALRELGFNEPCFTTYDDVQRLRNPFDYPKSEYDKDASYIEDSNEFIYNDKLCLENFEGNPKHFTQFVAAPLYQQAFRWFREKHNINNCITYSRIEDNNWFYQYYKSGLIGVFKSPEEAELACLIKLIEIVKQKL